MAARKPSKPASRQVRRADPAETRKVIAFDAESWIALDMLRRDSMKSLQELADEAFADLLKKHGRPVTLKAALRASAKSEKDVRKPR